MTFFFSIINNQGQVFQAGVTESQSLRATTWTKFCLKSKYRVQPQNRRSAMLGGNRLIFWLFKHQRRLKFRCLPNSNSTDLNCFSYHRSGTKSRAWKLLIVTGIRGTIPEELTSGRERETNQRKGIRKKMWNEQRGRLGWKTPGNEFQRVQANSSMDRTRKMNSPPQLNQINTGKRTQQSPGGPFKSQKAWGRAQQAKRPNRNKKKCQHTRMSAQRPQSLKDRSHPTTTNGLNAQVFKRHPSSDRGTQDSPGCQKSFKLRQGYQRPRQGGRSAIARSPKPIQTPHVKTFKFNGNNNIENSN